ncbi:MAG: 3-dehydroquinate synthase [Opitutales bacterium]|nr:3-dehydroquinate synthase [Opitutales bacterium]
MSGGADAELLRVELGARAYPIHFGPIEGGALAADAARRAEAGQRDAVVLDAAVAGAHGEVLERVFRGLPVLEVLGGEPSKDFATFEAVCDFLATERVDRSGALYAVGGGVIGDLAGFAAAAYLRGVRLYQVPTTLLAMVDSSVGGKTGINLRAGKNLVGAFHQPSAVSIDTAFLRSLPEREFRAGMAEVVKYGMLGDAALFDELEALGGSLGPEHPALPSIIRRNCALKAEIVRADETEQAASGGRALLNLGHTFGHAIEAVAGYGSYLHGEAVAVGLMLAAELSVHLGLIENTYAERVEALLGAIGLPARLARALSADALLEAMRSDKKNRGGRLTFIVLEAPGRAVTRSGIDEAVIRDLWLARGAR